MMQRLAALVRSPVGRLVAAAVGIAAVWILIRRSGPDQVLHALTHGSMLLPVVIFCEAGMQGCELNALYLLYGADRKKVPPAQFIRSGLICYGIMSVVPAGRAVAEATRAAMLAKYITGPKAAAAATRMQGMTLLGNALISILCAAVGLAVVGPNWFPAAVAANGVVTLALGSGVLWAGRRSGVGTWLGRRFQSGHQWGPAFDEHLRGEPGFPVAPLAWVFGGRCLQTLQRTVLIVAVGGVFDLIKGVLAQGINLVSSSIGDFVPGQMGITEAGYTFAANVLSLSPSKSISIALLAHVAVVFWVAISALTPLFWPAPKVVPPGSSPS